MIEISVLVMRRQGKLASDCWVALVQAVFLIRDGLRPALPALGRELL